MTEMTEEERAELNARNEKTRLDEWEKAEAYMDSPQQLQQRQALAVLKKLTIDASLNTDLEVASVLRDEIRLAIAACKEAGARTDNVQKSIDYWHELLKAGHFRRETDKP